MYSQSKANAYRVVRSHGLVTDASPARLVQIMFEQILSHLATLQGCMGRIHGNLPLNEVRIKCATMTKALRLIAQLDATLNMEKGGKIAENLRNLYRYMLNRLTQANVINDAQIVAEVARLVGTIKRGWDGIVTEAR